MPNATSPESSAHGLRSGSMTSRRAQLEAIQLELAQLNAVVDRTPLPDEAVGPKLAAERQRLRALRFP